MAKRGRKKKREKIGMWWGLSGEQKERIIGGWERWLQPFHTHYLIEPDQVR